MEHETVISAGTSTPRHAGTLYLFTDLQFFTERRFSRDEEGGANTALFTYPPAQAGEGVYDADTATIVALSFVPLRESVMERKCHRRKATGDRAF